jgi:hypothetical protein
MGMGMGVSEEGREGGGGNKHGNSHSEASGDVGMMLGVVCGRQTISVEHNDDLFRKC